MSDFDDLLLSLADLEDAVWSAGGSMREWPHLVAAARGHVVPPPPGTLAAALVEGVAAILAQAETCGVCVLLTGDRARIESADWCAVRLPSLRSEMDRLLTETGDGEDEIPARSPPPRRAYPRTLQVIVHDYSRWMSILGRRVGGGRSRPSGGPAPAPAPRRQPRMRPPAPH